MRRRRVASRVTDRLHEHVSWHRCSSRRALRDASQRRTIRDRVRVALRAVARHFHAMQCPIGRRQCNPEDVCNMLPDKELGKHPHPRPLLRRASANLPRQAAPLQARNRFWITLPNVRSIVSPSLAPWILQSHTRSAAAKSSASDDGTLRAVCGAFVETKTLTRARGDSPCPVTNVAGSEDVRDGGTKIFCRNGHSCQISRER